MAKTLLYRLFGVGKIPAQLSAELKLENVILLDEGISGSVTYLDFRAPGKRFGWSRQWFSAGIALTQVRLVALQYSNRLSTFLSRMTEFAACDCRSKEMKLC